MDLQSLPETESPSIRGSGSRGGSEVLSKKEKDAEVLVVLSLALPKRPRRLPPISSEAVLGAVRKKGKKKKISYLQCFVS
jgi:hypothetical protein